MPQPEAAAFQASSRPERRLGGPISRPGKRRQAGLRHSHASAPDHDFDTPEETVDACIRHLRERGSTHYTPLPASRACERPWQPTPHVLVNGRRNVRSRGNRHARRPAFPCSPRFRACSTPTIRHRRCALLRHLPRHLPCRRRPLHGSRGPARARLPALISTRIAAAVEPGTRVILINSPNNPTGAVYSRESLEGWPRSAARQDLWLVSDEVYWSLDRHRQASVAARPCPAWPSARWWSIPCPKPPA